MRVICSFIFILFFLGCSKDKFISYNPFEPNTNLETKTILSNGFVLKWACDGGLNTYSKEMGTLEIHLFEDCLNPGKIIGESYLFYLNNCSDDFDFLINFNQYKEDIETILSNYNGRIIEPAKLKNSGYLDFQAINLEEHIIDCRITCFPDDNLYLVIENWYRDNKNKEIE